MNNYYPTYNDIAVAVETLISRHIKNQQFDAIVALSRGGLVPGVIASHLLNCDLIPIDYSSTKGKGDTANSQLDDIKNAIPTSIKKVLLIDDIADTGHTLNDVISYLKSNKIMVTSFVIHYKQGAVCVPDFYHYKVPHDGKWVYYPWERACTTFINQETNTNE